MLKVELHAHTDLDPLDAIRHSTRELIDRAARLGYHALAITPHDRYFNPAAETDYAASQGIVLLPGIERSLGHAHLLLINFPAACADVRTFDDVAHLKRTHPGGLVIAPHALFPTRSAMGLAALERHSDLFDAIEVNAMFTRWIDFNRRVVAWARARGKPLVGNGDIHLLAQLGTTFSLVDAAPDPDAICAAIRAGHVEVRSRPLSLLRAATHFTRMAIVGLAGRGRRWLGRR